MQYCDMTAETLTWETYWFTRSLQGDITAIYNLEGEKLVSYSYNAWGETSTTYSNGGASTSAVKNSLRYRGYYFDTDLGLYYLQSRYYDARTCRFINADSLMSGANGSLHGANLFVYCFNNPINMTDGQGDWPKWVEDAWSWVVDTATDVGEFVNEVYIKSVTAYTGGGVGIGLPLGVIETTTHAEMGIAYEEGELKTGEFGENSIAVNVEMWSFGYYYTGFENENGSQEAWEGKFDIRMNLLSVGGSYIVSGHTEVYVSIFSLWENFSNYGKEHWGC